MTDEARDDDDDNGSKRPSTTNQLGQPFPEEENESTINEFHFSLNPFSHTLSKTLKVSCRQQNFGITVGEDEQDELNELNNRAYVPDIGKNSSASKSDQLHHRRHRLCLQLGLGFWFCQLTCLFLVFFMRIDFAKRRKENPTASGEPFFLLGNGEERRNVLRLA